MSTTAVGETKYSGELEQNSGEILRAWQIERFRLAVSVPILDEYRRVLEEMTRKRSSAVFDLILEVMSFIRR